MYLIRPLPEFTAWIDGLKDKGVRGVIVARLKRVERGLLGDVAPVGGSFFELKIHVGAGWRLYFTRRGTQIFVLLAGGSKRTQETDIKRAKRLAGLIDEERNKDE